MITCSASMLDWTARVGLPDEAVLEVDGWMDASTAPRPPVTTVTKKMEEMVVLAVNPEL